MKKYYMYEQKRSDAQEKRQVSVINPLTHPTMNYPSLIQDYISDEISRII